MCDNHNSWRLLFLSLQEKQQLWKPAKIILMVYPRTWHNLRSAACDLLKTPITASKTKGKCSFQNVKALSSAMMPAEQPSELIPAYQ